MPEVGESSGEVDYANMTWAWTADVSETGVENLMKVDVTVSYAGFDDTVRKVTGFIGEPVAPGQSNLAWNAGQPNRGEQQ